MEPRFKLVYLNIKQSYIDT